MVVVPTTKVAQRAELHKSILRIANDPRESVDRELDQEWRAFIAAKREAELDAIIQDENLRPEETRFSTDGGHGENKERVIEKLGVFFLRFFGLSSGGGE